MLIKEIQNKGSNRLNNVMHRNNAFNDDIIIRLYFNDWSLIQSMRAFGKRSHEELKAILNNMKVEGFKMILFKAKVQGNYAHINDIKKDLFVSFWELMETINYNFEIDNNEYVNIIDELLDSGNATVGDYCITLDNKDVDNLELLKEAKKEMMEEL